MKRLPAGAVTSVLILLLLPPGAAQNQPTDDCIIQVALHPNLTTVSISFDLLFDDEAWINLTNSIDANGDGNITDAEAREYERTKGGNVDGDAIPTTRATVLSAQFDRREYSGTTGAIPDSAQTQTTLLAFEGPVTERAGKVVRENWTYQFPDPLSDFGSDLNLADDAQRIEIAWGPAAAKGPQESVDVIETVVATAPSGWWIQVDGVRHQQFTFASGTGYEIQFVPNSPPKEPFFDQFASAPFMGLFLALATVALLRRQQIG